jgi:cytochrome b pre-mRNA-processing protein 3
LYNTLLTLSRNIYFYKNTDLVDSFETRIYLMFLHFSIFLIIFKKKGKKFDQKDYDSLFLSIENNLRELGFGDVSVNKKMKDLNKILYDILLKVRNDNKDEFNINKKLIFKYFKSLDMKNDSKYNAFESYFLKFYEYCYNLPLDNIVKNSINFKINN